MNDAGRISNRRLPKGYADFPSLRQDGCVYVDKTDLMWHLVHDEKYAFLSRPRRFGKSLLVSTIEAYFKGRRDLFEGLAVSKLEREWVARPVFRLDMSVGMGGIEDLKAWLAMQLRNWERQYLPEGPQANDEALGARFAQVLRAARRFSGHRVVVLVDEYDAPLQGSVLDPEAHEHVRSLYRSFFSVLKAEEANIRFVLLTGIAKFTQLSVFSVLNNLSNVSFLPRYASICGITERELHDTFGPEIQALSQASQTDAAEMTALLRERYDGYLFSEGTERLYNPFSVVSALANQSLDTYWYSSGQSVMLSRMLGEVWHELPELEGSRVDRNTLRTSDFSLEAPQVLLYQLGYLTIDRLDRSDDEYVLRFPNAEVRDALYKAILPSVSSLSQMDASTESARFRRALSAAEPDPEAAMRVFSAVLAGMPFPTGPHADKRLERDAQLVLTLLAGSAGMQTTAERQVLSGSIDVAIEGRGCVLVVELKREKVGGLEAARDQLAERAYARAYAERGVPVFEVACMLTDNPRGVARWEIERVK